MKATLAFEKGESGSPALRRGFRAVRKKSLNSKGLRPASPGLSAQAGLALLALPLRLQQTDNGDGYILTHPGGFPKMGGSFVTYSWGSCREGTDKTRHQEGVNNDPGACRSVSSLEKTM